MEKNERGQGIDKEEVMILVRNASDLEQEDDCS